jgi:HK97 gp10 family phage protein
MPAMLKSRIPEVAAELEARAHELAKLVAEDIAQAATERAQSLYGTYESGDHFSIHAEGSEVYAEWYWFFGEFGTSHQPARPFMLPAAEEARARVPVTARGMLRGL